MDDKLSSAALNCRLSAFRSKPQTTPITHTNKHLDAIAASSSPKFGIIVGKLLPRRLFPTLEESNSLLW
jgi:hypothetical protein